MIILVKVWKRCWFHLHVTINETVPVGFMKTDTWFDALSDLLHFTCFDCQGKKKKVSDSQVPFIKLERLIDELILFQVVWAFLVAVQGPQNYLLSSTCKPTPRVVWENHNLLMKIMLCIQKPWKEQVNRHQGHLLFKRS